MKTPSAGSKSAEAAGRGPEGEGRQLGGDAPVELGQRGLRAGLRAEVRRVARVRQDDGVAGREEPQQEPREPGVLGGRCPCGEDQGKKGRQQDDSTHQVPLSAHAKVAGPRENESGAGRVGAPGARSCISAGTFRIGPTGRAALGSILAAVFFAPALLGGRVLAPPGGGIRITIDASARAQVLRRPPPRSGPVHLGGFRSWPTSRPAPSIRPTSSSCFCRGPGP